MTVRSAKNRCTACAQAESLVASLAQTAEQQPQDCVDLLADLPTVLESALAFLFRDFDYEANIESNTAVAVRLIAIAADRLGLVNAELVQLRQGESVALQ